MLKLLAFFPPKIKPVKGQSASKVDDDNGDQSNGWNDYVDQYDDEQMDLCQCDCVSLVSRSGSLENRAFPEQGLTTSLRIAFNNLS